MCDSGDSDLDVNGDEDYSEDELDSEEDYSEDELDIMIVHVSANETTEMSAFGFRSP
jgi:hypothetical protein